MAEMVDEDIVKALRTLVGRIFTDCTGAYGATDGYEGQYEAEIREVVAAIIKAIEEQK